MENIEFKKTETITALALIKEFAEEKRKLRVGARNVAKDAATKFQSKEGISEKERQMLAELECSMLMKAKLLSASIFTLTEQIEEQNFDF